jgi:hypothetical protein
MQAKFVENKTLYRMLHVPVSEQGQFLLGQVVRGYLAVPTNARAITSFVYRHLALEAGA